MNRRAPILLAQPLPLTGPSWRLWGVPLAALLTALAIAASGRNIELFLALNLWVAQGPHAPWAWITALGDALTALCILLMLAKRRPDLVLAAMIAALLATLVTHGLKAAIDLPRPLAVLGPEMHVIGSTLTRDAYPSGHTATAFTLAGVFAAYLRSSVGLLLLIALATLVGVSRISVGAHWPLDVAAGAAVGWFSGLIGVDLMRRWGWQARSRTHAAIRLLLLASASWFLLGHDSGYPQARWLEQAIALVALLWALAYERLPLRPGQPGFLPHTANNGSDTLR